MEKVFAWKMTGTRATFCHAITRKKVVLTCHVTTHKYVGEC